MLQHQSKNDDKSDSVEKLEHGIGADVGVGIGMEVADGADTGDNAAADAWELKLNVQLL